MIWVSHPGDRFPTLCMAHKDLNSSFTPRRIALPLQASHMKIRKNLIKISISQNFNNPVIDLKQKNYKYLYRKKHTCTTHALHKNKSLIKKIKNNTRK